MILRGPDLVNLAPATDEQLGRGHLSHTSIGSLLACEQKYQHSYERRLQPKVRPVALGMGAAFADALEVGDPDVAWARIISDFESAQEEYKGDPWTVVPDRDKAEISAQITREAARCYLTAYGQAGERREVEMRSRIRNPKTGAPSLTFDLVARVDALSTDGREMIEDKLVGQIPRDGSMERRLTLDRQVSIGCYLAWRTSGTVVERVRYRMTKKPSIKRKQNESHDDYLCRIAADYAERPDFYLAEFPVTRTPEDFLRLEQELWRWAEQLRDARRDGVFPRNVAHCSDFGGCSFLPLCAREPGAEHQFEERPRRPEPVTQFVKSEERTAA